MPQSCNLAPNIGLGHQNSLQSRFRELKLPSNTHRRSYSYVYVYCAQQQHQQHQSRLQQRRLRRRHRVQLFVCVLHVPHPALKTRITAIATRTAVTAATAGTPLYSLRRRLTMDPECWRRRRERGSLNSSSSSFFVTQL